MSAALLSFVLAAQPAVPCQPEECVSYLYQPSYCHDFCLRLPAERYCPQPGDIFLATDKNRVIQWGHNVAGTRGVHHSGIVVARPDGSIALLEGGPHNTAHCEIVDLIGELRSYACHERVWIRKRRCPLTCEQNAALTAFACRQDGKRFAFMRVLGQLTPLRARGPFINLKGGPHGDRNTYFCAELAMEACVAAGLVDPCTTRPSATYPRDMFLDDSSNRYLACHLDLSCGWYPPARWTECPATEADACPVQEE
jgi:hypothetical protein